MYPEYGVKQALMSVEQTQGPLIYAMKIKPIQIDRGKGGHTTLSETPGGGRGRFLGGGV